MRNAAAATRETEIGSEMEERASELIEARGKQFGRFNVTVSSLSHSLLRQFALEGIWGCGFAPVCGSVEALFPGIEKREFLV